MSTRSRIDWAPVYERYQLAVHRASEPFGADQDQLAGAMVFIPGALWRDPAQVAHWVRDLPADRDIVVYCVYGHEVGRSTALRLRWQGISARYLRGGIDGWQAAKRPLQPKGDTPQTITPGSSS